MIYTCCDKLRRDLVDAHPTLNGINHLEVLDLDAPPDSPRQRTLMVRLLKPVPATLGVDAVAISGGERIRRVGIEWVGVADAPPAGATAAEQALFTGLPAADHVLLLRTDTAGDHSTYRLRIAEPAKHDLDPRLSTIDFAFKVECPSDFDCAPRHDCAPDPALAPDINYLARDFASLRRLVMDRLARQMSGWRDRSPADLVTTLGELIAYAGDLQHYELDAITTEAYLHTARKRSSLRRHALLVDYTLHEGSNARAWLHLTVSGGPFALPAGLRFYTRVPGAPSRLAPGSSEERHALTNGPQVFEPLYASAQAPVVREEHNKFFFHTWSDTRCCLPRGANAATLRGHFPELAPGDVLVLQEVAGPHTGDPADADPAHRHAVRLTAVHARNGDAPLVDPLDDTPITEITWHDDDALPFALCISSQTDAAHDNLHQNDLSVVLGNVILVDHGRGFVERFEDPVPGTRLHYAPPTDPCRQAPPEPLPPRYRPALGEGPVTHQGHVLRTVREYGLTRREWVRFDPDASATAALRWRAADTLPVLTLETDPTDIWIPKRTLLASNPTDQHFVLETEDDGSARVRFGDDTHGRRPDAGTTFTARYRLGNGPQGNVGADSISHVVTGEARIESVLNPLPARGGLAPESAAEARRRAPYAFRTQERAVTPADYAAVSERLPDVQRAAAALRWTGSWHTVFVTVDRTGGDPVDEAYADTVVEHLDRYRMAGHDVHVDEPSFVSLEIDLLVCVAPGRFRSDVRRGLLDVLSRHTRADGSRGLFHPDNFSFGQTVFLGPLYAAARTVPGVTSVQVTRFRRQGQDDPKPLADGFMTLSRLEIARLDNDPNFPEHGVLRIELHGGK